MAYAHFYVLFNVKICLYTHLNDQIVLFLTIQFSKVRSFQILLCIINSSIKYLAQSAGAVEYTDCISADGYDYPQRVSW